MTIDDETLCAFLDQELPESQMQAVREALSKDPALAARLADLALLDQRLNQHFDAINHLPLPPGVEALLAEQPESAPATSRVLRFPLWRRGTAVLQQHAAAVAGLALVTGFILSRLVAPAAEMDQWAEVQQVLEARSSGSPWPIEGGTLVEPRLSFIDHNGRYCRQYRLASSTLNSDDVACRGSDGWRLVARLPIAGYTEGYAPASGSAALDQVLDGMIQGDVIDPEQETRLVEQRWQPLP